MKICPYCLKEFEHPNPKTKFCSFSCGRTFNGKKRWAFLKANPILKAEKLKRDKSYPSYLTYIRKRDRLRHNLYEKNRTRRLKGINSDSDLKCRPKGSGTLSKHGYRIVTNKDHPNAWRTGRIFEHVLIMSNYLGRPLVKGETVHHKNGIKHDNRIENLELWSNSHPYGQRIEDKINWCKEFLDQYGMTVIIKENT